MNKIEIIIFDADGTIFDSMPNVAKIFADILVRYGIPRRQSENYLYATAGTSTYEQFKTILNKHHKPTDRVKLLVKEFNDLMEGHIPRIFADVVPTFKNLKNYKKIVSTNLRQDILNARIKHYGLHKYLDKYLGTNCFKSKEEHFDYIKKIYHLSDKDFKKKVILVGDGKTDMEFARKYKIVGVGKVCIEDAKTLKKAGALHTINNLSEVVKILKNE